MTEEVIIIHPAMYDRYEVAIPRGDGTYARAWAHTLRRARRQARSHLRSLRRNDRKQARQDARAMKLGATVGPMPGSYR